MNYTKPALEFRKQADLLLSRGMVGDADHIESVLQHVNYYRLSGYWYTFRDLPGDNLKPGTTFEQVWRRYTFDRQIRVLAIDAIERIEIAVRTKIVNYHTIAHGAFGYTAFTNLPGLDTKAYSELNEQIREAAARSSERFVDHYKTKYTSETELPLWMACELITFGAMFTFFRGCEPDIKKKVGADLGVTDLVIENWLMTLNQIRNICAHHSRLWNRTLGIRPVIPNKDSAWHDPVKISNDKLFGVLSVLHYLLKQVAPRSKWKSRLVHLITNEYPDIHIDRMGFPANWETSPIWAAPAIQPAQPESQAPDPFT